MGMPFNGLSLEGYDNAKKEFTSIWIDNMGTGTSISAKIGLGDEMSRDIFIGAIAYDLAVLESTLRAETDAPGPHAAQVTSKPEPKPEPEAEPSTASAPATDLAQAADAPGQGPRRPIGRTTRRTLPRAGGAGQLPA